MTTIRVLPAHDAARALRHPTAGALKDDPRGTAWPADQFTFRRLADGALIEAPAETPSATSTDDGESRSRRKRTDPEGN